MSWQIGSLVILALALAAGFAWYERGHPDSRVVALVATLAALAALGRIAFAALPNVKPTTDIVLISGLALGAAPGFTVGALAGLTSNFFFGQGPWTPWQMAAWGAVGIIGALLGRVAGRRGRPAGRWALGAACLGCGLVFPAVQDLGDWVTFSDHSVSQLTLYLGRGVGFDLVHGVSCLVFALAFGPPLARSLRRFTDRLEVTWRPGPVLPTVAAITLSATAVAAAALLAGTLGGGAAQAAASPSGYLLSAQNSDGGFGAAPGGASVELYSGWAALGLASAGLNPASVDHGGASLLAYIEQAGGGSDPGAVERSILVATAAGASPRSFGGQDLIAALERRLGRDGAVSEQVNLTAFAVLALRGAGIPVSSRTLGWLGSQQNGDGGFSFAGGGGGGSDVDDTGAVLEALGARQPTASRAERFLRRQQNGDGGFPSQPGAGSNAQSTAWAVQGLLAAGVNPDGMRQGGHSPLDYLRSMIAADGHVRYSSSSDQTPVWVTAQALMALQRRPLPLAPVAHGGGAAGRARSQGRGHGRGSTASRRARRGRRRKGHAGRTPALTGLARLAAEAGVVSALALGPTGVS